MPPTEHLVCCEVGVSIEANEAGEAAIDRLILARLAILTGHVDASRWDGFADLHEGDLTVRIDYVQEA